MLLKRVICLLMASAVVTGFCTESFAQGPGQRGILFRSGKFLGLGYGPGNHWRNPMVNPNYYNPYTPHNSMLTYGTQNGPTRHQYHNQSNFPNTWTPRNQFQPQPVNPTEIQPAPENNANEDSPPNTSATNENAINGWGQFSDESIGLFEQPVIGDRGYRPHVDSKNPSGDIVPDKFWRDQ